MNDLVNHRILSTEPSSIRVVFEEVLRLQKSGQTITRLDIGSPNFQAPDFIVKAAGENLEKGMYGYSSNWGLEPLRKSLAKKYLDRGGVNFNPQNEVIVTNGASEAVAMVICSLLNDGEHFLIPTPTWPHYVADCKIFDKAYKEISTHHSDDFKLTPENLREAIDEGSRVLILNSPGNPTGSVYSKNEFKAIYDICVERDILIVLDEIYEDINFEFTDTLLSIGVEKEYLIYINGFSKNYGMTGFRLGFILAHEPIARQLIKYHQYTNVCGQAFVQQACADFLADTFMVRSYHDYVLKSLRGSQKVLMEFYKSGKIPMSKPSGAFYAFAKIPENFDNAKTFSLRLLAEKKISVVPGDAFGNGNDNFYRMSYGSVGEDDLRNALNKISEYY